MVDEEVVEEDPVEEELEKDVEEAMPIQEKIQNKEYVLTQGTFCTILKSIGLTEYPK